MQLFSDLQVGEDGGGGGYSQQQSTLAGDTAGHGVRVLGCDLKILICQLGVVNRRDDGARHVLGAFDSVKSRIRLQRDTANRGIKFLQAARGTHKSSAGTEHGDEVSDTAVSLLPDFVRSTMIVRAPV